MAGGVDDRRTGGSVSEKVKPIEEKMGLAKFVKLRKAQFKASVEMMVAHLDGLERMFDQSVRSEVEAQFGDRADNWLPVIEREVLGEPRDTNTLRGYRARIAEAGAQETFSRLEALIGVLGTVVAQLAPRSPDRGDGETPPAGPQSPNPPAPTSGDDEYQEHDAASRRHADRQPPRAGKTEQPAVAALERKDQQGAVGIAERARPSAVAPGRVREGGQSYQTVEVFYGVEVKPAQVAKAHIIIADAQTRASRDGRTGNTEYLSGRGSQVWQTRLFRAAFDATLAEVRGNRPPAKAERDIAHAIAASAPAKEEAVVTPPALSPSAMLDVGAEQEAELADETPYFDEVVEHDDDSDLGLQDDFSIGQPGEPLADVLSGGDYIDETPLGGLEALAEANEPAPQSPATSPVIEAGQGQSKPTTSSTGRPASILPRPQVRPAAAPPVVKDPVRRDVASASSAMSRTSPATIDARSQAQPKPPVRGPAHALPRETGFRSTTVLLDDDDDVSTMQVSGPRAAARQSPAIDPEDRLPDHLRPSFLNHLAADDPDDE